MTKSKIAFIGLGNMGLPMATNLAEAGHSVVGTDPAVTEAEFALVESAAECAANAEIVIMMLPRGEASRAVAAEIAPVMAPGSLLIDCSTIDMQSAQAVHELAAGSGLLSLDAPVSGGAGGAAAGTLTFMVGGSEEAFAAGAPLFDIMGSKTVHCGGPTAGQAVKICNNMLLSVTMVGACEAFNLGDALGIDRQQLFDVMSTSSGSCWPVNTYCPLPGIGPESPADRNFQPGFAANLMVKDAGLAQEAAHSVGSATPLAAQAHQLYLAMQKAGLGDMDFSAMIEYLAERPNSSESS